MQEIKVFNSHTQVEVFPVTRDWYGLNIMTRQGMIRSTLSLTENELDLVVTALLMLKEKLSKVSQA